MGERASTDRLCLDWVGCLYLDCGSNEATGGALGQPPHSPALVPLVGFKTKLFSTPCSNLGYSE